MRILLSWARRKSDPDIGILLKRLAEQGHDVVYFIGSEHDRHLQKEGGVFHLYTDAEKAIPASEVNVDTFLPLEERFIEQLHRTESIILTMMNRFFDRLCVDERRRIYYEMVRYWRGVLHSVKPDAIIFPNMPHFVYDYIIYTLAQLSGIKTILFDDTRFPGRLLPFTNFDQLTESLKNEFRKYQGRKVLAQDLAEDIRRYYEPRSSRDFGAVPSYISDLTKKHRMWKFDIPLKPMYRSLQDFSFLTKAPRYVLWFARERGLPFFRKLFSHVSYPYLPDLRKAYVSLEREPDFGKTFVYFPLQKQPEKTTSPQGGVFVDQVLALEILSASIPQGVTIYVKEHPLQWLHFGVRWNSSRYRGYYDRIANIRNVIIIPMTVDSYRLINESLTTSAVTGSAGFEAVMRGKPALIFGKVWYEDCPGIIKVSGVADCREAFRTILNGYVPHKEIFLNYLKCFESVTLRAYIAQTSGRASTVSASECMENISTFVLKTLRKETL